MRLSFRGVSAAFGCLSALAFASLPAAAQKSGPVPVLPPTPPPPRPQPLRRSADDYIRRAAYYSEVGDYSRAISELSLALDSEPDRAEALLLRAQAHVQVAQASERVGALSAEVGKAGNAEETARLLARRAFAFYNIGEYDRAVADYSDALRLNPGWTQLYMGRALALSSSGHLREAAEDYAHLTGAAVPDDPRRL